MIIGQICCKVKKFIQLSQMESDNQAHVKKNYSGAAVNTVAPERLLLASK
jgi:hypothetical protein